MIKFFRKIRQQLMAEKKTSQYLKYAIGEVVLVVIGILIALSVNNLNLKRLNKNKEKALLEQLAKDIGRAVSDIEYNLSLHDEAISSAQYVLKHMDSQKPYEDSVGHHISKAFLWSKLVIDLGAFENIKSTGLDIISNVELRNEIVNQMSGKLKFHQHFEGLLGHYSEEFRRNYGAKYFVSSYQGVSLNTDGINWGITEPRNYESLRKDSEFLYHLKSFLSLTSSFQQLEHRRFHMGLNALSTHIKEELEAL